MSYFTEKGWTERSVFELLNNEDGSIFEAGDLLVVDSEIKEDVARFKLKENFNQYQELDSNWIGFNNLKYLGELAEQCENFYDCDSNEACIGECKFKEKGVNTQNNPTEYEVGELVEVIDKQHGHGFKIGDVVVIGSIDTGGSYQCVDLDEKDYWWLSEDEFKPYKKVIDVAESDQPKLRTAEDFRKLTPETEIEVVIDGHKTVIPLLELLMIARLSGSVLNKKRISTMFYWFGSLFGCETINPVVSLDLECETKFTNLDSFLDKFFIGNKKLEIEKEMQWKLDQIEKLRNEVRKLGDELSKYS